MKTTWVIIGATSIISEAFGHEAAKKGHPLWLIGRDIEKLQILAANYRLRYQIDCEIIHSDFKQPSNSCVDIIQNSTQNLFLFIAAAEIVENEDLSRATIRTMINVNIHFCAQLIHGYLKKSQPSHGILFLSSAAAGRARAKNSLYGASKLAIEYYLDGIRQKACPNVQITIARLGFIDTKQTFGKKGIVLEATPVACAQTCWRAFYRGKRSIYYPSFWKYIIKVLRCLPLVIYKKLPL